MFDKQERWHVGDKMSARHLNAPLDVVDTVRAITAAVGSGMTVMQGSGGTVIGLDPTYRYDDQFLGVITSTPPTGVSDFDAADARYWVKRVYVDAADVGPNSNVALRDDPPPQAGDGSYVEHYPVAAINLAEVADITTGEGTHSLAVNSPVRCWGMYDRADSPRKHYFFFRDVNTPLGEFQHQVYQMVTQNEIGFDFTMAHALP